MKQYLIYDIKNIEPIKITSSIKQSDAEFTKSFISGSVIRGAFISNYIMLKKIDDINVDNHKELLLKDKIRFLNAYPLNDNRAYPFPRCYFALKDDIKKFQSKGYLEISANIDDFEDKDIEKVKGIEFVNFDFYNKVLTQVNVSKSENLHIRKKNNGEDNKIFRYEAIDKGQNFRGIIECADEKTLEIVKSVLSEGTFYLGGSKGSGYGLCELYNFNEQEIHPEFLEVSSEVYEDDEEYFEDAETVYLYALSDIIYRDNRGEYKTYIDEEVIKNKLSLESATLINSFVETEIFTGFNNKWGYRLPLINGIKAGSILEYRIDGEVDYEGLKSFISEGIGERKSEGFGRFIILTELDTEEIKLKRYKKEKVTLAELSNEDAEQMQLIVNRIYAKKLELSLLEKVLFENRKVKKKVISDTQWGKLLRLVSIIENMSQEEGLKKIKEYFDNINNKENNRDLADALEQQYIGDENLKSYIENYLENTDLKNFQIYHAKEVKIGKITSVISKNEIFRYKVRMLKELFRLQLKSNYDSK